MKRVRAAHSQSRRKRTSAATCRTTIVSRSYLILSATWLPRRLRGAKPRPEIDFAAVFIMMRARHALLEHSQRMTQVDHLIDATAEKIVGGQRGHRRSYRCEKLSGSPTDYSNFWKFRPPAMNWKSSTGATLPPFRRADSILMNGASVVTPRALSHSRDLPRAATKFQRRSRDNSDPSAVRALIVDVAGEWRYRPESALGGTTSPRRDQRA